MENTEAEVRRLRAHVGVPFEPACLRWYENEEPIRTPSSEQVRPPIFRQGLDQWRRFDAELGEARRILAEAIAAYPARGG